MTSRVQSFKTVILAREENLAGLAELNRALIGRAERMDSGWRTVLDLDSTEIPVHGEQEQSAYNGHFESTCYHPLLLFNGDGDCLAAQLQPGNVHSAEGWEEVLLPEIERQQERGKEVAFQADAALPSQRSTRPWKTVRRVVAKVEQASRRGAVPTGGVHRDQPGDLQPGRGAVL